MKCDLFFPDGPDRLRSPSTGNLASNQYSPQDPGSYNRREIDPRSKSTSNLHVDTSFERTDLHPHMRGAASVGMLHPSAQGYPQYPPAGQRHDNLHSDYENQPQVVCACAVILWGQSGESKIWHL